MDKLADADESVRERAAEELEGAGDRLSAEQVRKLAAMANEDSPTWSKELERDEGHHCTWYERTSLKYYAGRSLASSTSPHVTTEIREMARKAESEGKKRERVTDPGWV